MAYHFGLKSVSRLATCDERIIHVLVEAIGTSPVDFAVTCGHRGQEDQDKAVAGGKSKTPWPTSKHNRSPSHAVDIVPVRGGAAVWDDASLFKDIANHIMTVADRLGIGIRWGGDWNCNHIADERFVDMPHFELKD